MWVIGDKGMHGEIEICMMIEEKGPKVHGLSDLGYMIESCG